MARTKQVSAKGGIAKVSTSSKQTQSQRAGLTLPVARIHRHLRKETHEGQRISAGAAVYLASVLEYLTTEIIELSGVAAKEHKKTRISPRFLNLAIRHDDELSEMFKDVTISQGGVKPQQLAALHPKPRG
uniref:Histone H2A n=1 Tax=Caenorhabditis tropicalis TaxID=1561998 RepID=A0A1I7T7U5_9PELO